MRDERLPCMLLLYIDSTCVVSVLSGQLAEPGACEGIVMSVKCYRHASPVRNGLGRHPLAASPCVVARICPICSRPSETPRAVVSSLLCIRHVAAGKNKPTLRWPGVLSPGTVLDGCSGGHETGGQQREPWSATPRMCTEGNGSIFIFMCHHLFIPRSRRPLCSP